MFPNEPSATRQRGLTLVRGQPAPFASLKLKFDTTTARYNLSWRMPKDISGCQEMLLRFTGGVERTVRFHFH
jgi:hypothetical protein